MIAKPSQNTSEEQLLGEIETHIVGLQYHDAAFEPGEAIHLEREPDNVHDGQATRVENQAFEQIGYLPKKLASWLAPLIVAGKLRVDG